MSGNTARDRGLPVCVGEWGGTDVGKDHEWHGALVQYAPVAPVLGRAHPPQHFTTANEPSVHGPGSWRRQW